MAEAIEKLIAENRWNPNMEDAPKDGTLIELMYPNGERLGEWRWRDDDAYAGGGFWSDGDYQRLDGDEWFDGALFRVPPDDRLADVCAEMLKALKFYRDDHHGIAGEALARANEIATKGD